MTFDMRQSPEPLARAELRLRQCNLRYTTARRVVLSSLHASAGPQSPTELAERLGGTIPLSSLYRTLTALEEAGVITRFHDVAGVARYELAEWLAGHHHHITCRVCGGTEDLPLPEKLETSMGEVIAVAQESFGFKVESHRLDLQGVCRSCR